ncbi:MULTISPECIES: DUF1127 domain-containing protein [Mameliella]|jgi:uncharacterized protein YjiS (DUF1127 family)|uniref:YjiS-like domain-containing protein n=1 Tax=Mameliella alba TaxID=561184 RepID=A0A0B3S982_9RHOB|nr:MULTISPECIES: DUF1127 domain-containing protein [Mameliella]MBV6635687.1 DUF1127 domain-containing protein [Mameliella sp.]MCR9275345.1 DUF1127 domain-containing protein [Paracoccaceae bacterium]ODM50132.1 hypothetical protein A9320_12395 [Ruegeria sp. PBVC088]KHQ53236.1 hypothetical protein OA50_02263 [Mameliella alba]MBY6121669.1 DUF1127 domain-containing protein [Mameliella alba]
MAAFDTSRPFAASGSAAQIGNIFTSAFGATRPYHASETAARIGSIFAAVFGAVAAWNDARMTRNSLSALTDRELEDIGLHRGDIDSVARRY